MLSLRLPTQVLLQLISPSTVVCQIRVSSHDLPSPVLTFYQRASTAVNSKATVVPRPNRQRVMERSRWDIAGRRALVVTVVVSSLPVSNGLSHLLTRTSTGTQVTKAR